MELWVVAILLLVLGLGLAILEVFVPSGGLLGFLCVCSIIAAVIVGFRYSASLGFGIFVLAIFALPAVIAVALHYWPATAMGRRILLMIPRSGDVLPDSPKKRRLKALIGQVGEAKSKMLPSGVVRVAGRNVDAVSEGMPVDPGQRVRIIEVRGNRVVVRPTDEETPLPTDENPLARPVDSVVEDPFDEAAG
jgi:membrane-bound ClpP family serine protease